MSSTPISEKITPKEPKNEKDSYNFMRTIEKEENKKIILSFSIILYEDEICIKVKEEEDNLYTNLYEKSYNHEDFKKMNEFFEILKNLKLIFNLLKKTFEQNKDTISLEKEQINIKFTIHLEILEDEIILTIPLIKKTNQDVIKDLKDSIYYLNKEKISLKEEIKHLKENIIIDLTNKLNENEKKYEEKENDLNKKMLKFKNEIKEKENELKEKLKQNDLGNTVNSLRNELKEIAKYIKEKLNPEEIEEKEITYYYCLREVEKESKDDKKDQDEENFNIINTTPMGNCIMDKYIFAIYLYLYEDKIKIKINEIQDNLKSNYLIYESIFTLDDFKIGDNNIKFGEIKTIYKLLCELFEGKKDTLSKEDDNKIIIKVKFPVGLKEEELSLDIDAKGLSLEKTLNNLKQSVKFINKENKKLKNEIEEKNNQMIERLENMENEIEEKNNQIHQNLGTMENKKEEENDRINEKIREMKKEIDKDRVKFQKEILEKVYPIGSYYWSEKNTSPESLFGGKWDRIEGRFIFASDCNHSVGSTGGAESHCLSTSEMPSHSHSYSTFYVNSWDYSGTNNSYRVPANSGDSTTWTKSGSTGSCGSGSSHSHMPPYVVANCWKRIS